MLFPKLLQAGETRPFPVWGQYLAQLGHYMLKCGADSDCSPPSIAIICLPRVDYGAFFLAFGAVNALSTLQQSDAKVARSDISLLVGKSVSYLRVRDAKPTVILGQLECIDPTTGTATIVTKRNERANEIYQISEKDWHWIRSTQVKFDLERGATDHQRDRAREGYSEYQLIAKATGHPLASAVTLICESYIGIFAEKSRLIEEIETIELQYEDASIAAGLLLNSEMDNGQRHRDQGRYMDLLPSSSSITKTTAPVVVIEAGRRLGDQLSQLPNGKRAIVIMAANKRSYSDVSELLATLINYRGLQEPPPNIGESPHYLKTIFIR